MLRYIILGIIQGITEFLPVSSSGHLVIGFIFSLLIGLLSLRILKIVLGKAKLYYFGYYCIIIALITLLYIRA